MSAGEKAQKSYADRQPTVGQTIGRTILASSLTVLAELGLSDATPSEKVPVIETTACQEYADASGAVVQKLALQCINNMQHDKIALVDLRPGTYNMTRVASLLQQELYKDTDGLVDVSVANVPAIESAKASAVANSCVGDRLPSDGPTIVQALQPDTIKNYTKLVTIDPQPHCGNALAGTAIPAAGTAQMYDTTEKSDEQLVRDTEHEVLHLYRLGHADALRSSVTNQEVLEGYLYMPAEPRISLPLHYLFYHATSTGRGEGDDELRLSPEGSYGSIMGHPSARPLDDRLYSAQIAVLGYVDEDAGQRLPNYFRYENTPITLRAEDGQSAVVGVDIDYKSPLDNSQFTQLLVTPMMQQADTHDTPRVAGASVYLANGQHGSILRLGDVVRKTVPVEGEEVPDVQEYEFMTDTQSVILTFDGTSVRVSSQPLVMPK
jgi:hypothetical protein